MVDRSRCEPRVKLRQKRKKTGQDAWIPWLFELKLQMLVTSWENAEPATKSHEYYEPRRVGVFMVRSELLMSQVSDNILVLTFNTKYCGIIIWDFIFISKQIHFCWK